MRPIEQAGVAVLAVGLACLGQARAQESAAVAVASMGGGSGCGQYALSPNCFGPPGYSEGSSGGYDEGGAEGESLADAGRGPGTGQASVGATPLPFIQGDSPFAAYGSLDIGGIRSTIAHPRFMANRLNLAENASPIPQDRVFVSYRHFEGVTETDILSGPNFDGRSVLDVDRVLFGLERTMCDGLMSLEVRVPFHNQLGSNLAMGQNGTTVTGVPITDTSFELDNVSIGFKALLRKTRSYAVSGGVALNLPTGRNVRIEGSVDTNSFYVDLPTLQPPYYAPAQFDFLGVVGNETVNLTPFLALSYNPDSIFFMQNFLQIDVPLNTSSADLAIQGTVDGIALGYPNNPGIYSVSMTEQALMRIDAQFGCWLYRNPCSNFINSIAGLFEVHYTGTLGDAKIARAPIVMGSMIGGVDGVDDINLTAGNIANRMDIVNFVFATAIQSGKTEVTPGFTVPISTGDNKPFDWEFALLLNRRF